ncbi:hypothetical protein [Sphingobium sp.]|uniref:hypothetical protein n=1 Tax=Sphingobium sp. TaxID=1912891 RepID=UPI002579A60E|nr:hypothetical protein [Sphingobium sp.]
MPTKPAAGQGERRTGQIERTFHCEYSSYHVIRLHDKEVFLLRIMTPPLTLRGDDWAKGLGIVVIGFLFALTVAYIVAISPIIGVIIAMSSMAILSASSFELAACVLLVIILFQNTATAIALRENYDAFNVMRGLPFLYSVIVSSLGVFWLKKNPLEWSVQTKQIIKLAIYSLAICVGYFILGMITAKPVSAITYFRGVLSGILFIPIGLCASRRPLLMYGTILSAVILAIFFGFIEFFFRTFLYDAIDMVGYLGSKGNGARFDYATTRDLISGMQTELFNTKFLAGKILFARLQGPNLHSISYGYSLAASTIVALRFKKYWIAALAMFMLFLAGSKGALITTIFALFFWILFSRSTLPRRMVINTTVIILLAYVAIWTIIGASNGDYHVIGFKGGIDGFIRNPLGHGLGAGGNLGSSDGDVTEAADKWKTMQRYGATYGLESATGVLLYQMGVAAFIPLLLFFRLAKTLFLPTYVHGGMLLGFAILATIANSCFQEEALFSPLSIGLMVLLSMLHIGFVERQNLSAIP